MRGTTARRGPARWMWAVLLLILTAPRSGRAVLGCGGAQVNPPPAPVKTIAPAKAASAPSNSTSASSFSSDVPRALMPPPFQFGSKRAERRLHPDWAACRGPSQLPSSDPVADAALLAKGCGAATKMHPLTSVKGAQAEGAPAQRYKLKAEANHCYRVYVVAAPGIHNLEIFVVDSEGAVALEARSDEPRVVAPDDGATCFKSSDDAEVRVSVGAGEGAYALQIWGD